MLTAKIIEWARFYGQLSGVAAWNGFLMFLRCVFGAGVAQTGGLVDLRSIPVAGFGYILAGTVLGNVALTLFQHPLPAPVEPSL